MIWNKLIGHFLIRSEDIKSGAPFLTVACQISPKIFSIEPTDLSCCLLVPCTCHLKIWWPSKQQVHAVTCNKCWGIDSFKIGCFVFKQKIQNMKEAPLHVTVFFRQLVKESFLNRDYMCLWKKSTWKFCFFHVLSCPLLCVTFLSPLSCQISWYIFPFSIIVRAIISSWLKNVGRKKNCESLKVPWSLWRMLVSPTLWVGLLYCLLSSWCSPSWIFSFYTFFLLIFWEEFSSFIPLTHCIHCCLPAAWWIQRWEEVVGKSPHILVVLAWGRFWLYFFSHIVACFSRLWKEKAVLLKRILLSPPSPCMCG